ncbi:MAG: YibE/F family protein [Candidatus Marinimicrobia bacterium]|nr:YibE/F family protein [Candidatus Neomarinimicrobiota bacterium]
MKTQQNYEEILFPLVITFFSLVLFFLPTGFENTMDTSRAFRTKAVVLGTDNSDLQKQGMLVIGSQVLQLQILKGRYKGQIVESHNLLNGQLIYDRIYLTGDRVLAVGNVGKNQKITSLRAIDIYRLNTEIVLFILFAAYLIFFARWTGFKALISFIFTALAIWKILIPSFLHGVQPLMISFLIVCILTTVIILLISGFNKKGLVALTGSIAGVALTTLLAIIFGFYFRIPGTAREFSEVLLYSGYAHLNLSDIFIAGIFISAAGAVMDVAMDIAASQNEIVIKKPDIAKVELIKSGFNIASPVIGTMTTTLLFAYSGSFIFIFMVFMAKGTPVNYIFNINFIAAEILHTLVGSFGLVLVAPATAIIGGFVFPAK